MLRVEQVTGSRSFRSHPEGVPEEPLTPEAVSVELRPLILWMANTTELLSFVQEKVLEMEKEADQEGERRHPHFVRLSYPEPGALGYSSQHLSRLRPQACPQTLSSAMTWNCVTRPWPSWTRSSCAPSSSPSTTSPRWAC